MDVKNISLEQTLQAYRVMNTPTTLSWKQHWAQEMFSNNDYLMCSEDEKRQFEKRLLECECTIAPRIEANEGISCTLKTVVDLLHDPNNKDITKTKRKVLYSSINGERPKGARAFEIWNGFQVIDMDIKNEDIAKKLKTYIFNHLYKCNWFLGVTLSSSGNGLHVYTKITLAESDNNDASKKKLMYLTNFRHKFSFVYIVCLSATEELGFEKEDLIKWMDLAMFRPSQGAFIGYDKHPLINTHFFEDFMYVNFDNIEDTGNPNIDWVSHPDLKKIFKRWEWFEDGDGAPTDITTLHKEGPDGMPTKIHYKHFERWRLANTLVNLFDKIDGYKYLRMICSNNIKDQELQADCNTAAAHRKPIDLWAVNRLNKYHGFKIKLNIHQEVEDSELFNAMERIDNPTLIRESDNLKNFHLTKDQYLSDILDDLLSSVGRVTLIEAGAGVGKTEMVKQMARKGKKMVMVMPFTSTIKSKVENDPDWYYSYGNRKPRLDIDQSLSLTIDKFSHMNLMDIKAAGFDYIFIDESHLMFQSEYRPVMPKVIEMIRNSEVPIILMSGTPSGEMVFFPDIVHLKVVKDDIRKKEFKVNMVENPSDLIFHMCRHMANDIMEGRRVLFPTNQGTLYSKQIKAAVTFFLQNDHQNFNEVNLHYYKKSNVGEDFMDKVNFEKTIADTQILLCTNYLSVGVDILDKYNFTIYFADLMMPQEVEQFANRLRSNDLYINLYIAKNDAEGNSKGINKYNEINFQLNDEEIKNAHSILRLCNAMIERNPIEYKYNSLISSIIYDNKFIEYNEVENKYYLNEIAYKVINFERKYRDYVQQLPVLMKGMAAYGYQISSVDLKNPNEDGALIFKNLKDMTKLAYDEQLALNTQHIEELMDIITEDRLQLYKDVLSGKFDIRKGDEWKEDIVNHKMIVKNIEVFEKVVPIFTSMSKQYEIKDIKNIFDYCRNKNNTFNFSAINRIRMLINIVYNDSNQRLDIPIKDFMREAYEFSDRSIVNKFEIKEFIKDFTIRYAKHESDDKVIIDTARLTMDTMEKTFEKIFKCLVNVSRPKKDGMVTMERVELLWKTRDYYNSEDQNENIYILEDFLNLADNDMPGEIE